MSTGVRIDLSHVDNFLPVLGLHAIGIPPYIRPYESLNTFRGKISALRLFI